MLVLLVGGAFASFSVSYLLQGSLTKALASLGIVVSAIGAYFLWRESIAESFDDASRRLRQLNPNHSRLEASVAFIVIILAVSVFLPSLIILFIVSGVSDYKLSGSVTVIFDAAARLSLAGIAFFSIWYAFRKISQFLDDVAREANARSATPEQKGQSSPLEAFAKSIYKTLGFYLILYGAIMQVPASVWPASDACVSQPRRVQGPSSDSAHQ